MKRAATALLGLALFNMPLFAQGYTIATYAGPALPISGSQATTQAIDFPYAVISDGAGGFYLSSYAPSRIYRVTVDGTLTIIAGAGVPGYRGDGGPAVSAQISGPMGLALDAAGNLFFADNGNNCIREITSEGVVLTVAGTSVAGFSGDGGPAASAQLNAPRSVAIDASGNLYIADTSNVRVRVVDATGTITTVAGIGVAGFAGDGGAAINAQIGAPEGIAIDSTGNLFIAEPSNARVRKVGTDGVINTVAGNGIAGFSGDGGPATSAQLNLPYGVAIDPTGNLFISDLNNGRIRMVNTGGMISTVAGSATRGYAGDGGPATSAQMVSPYRVAVDENGNLLIADGSNQRVRKVGVDGIISTVAGNGTAGFSGDGQTATTARLNAPYGVAVDAAGNVFIADLNNNRIRKVTASGVITTVAGSGTAGGNGDGGAAINAQLHSPTDVLIDGSGNLFVADSLNYRVRKIAPAGVITTVAGRGTSGFSGDTGAATAAQFNAPVALGMDNTADLFISDLNNQRIRRMAANGVIVTVAGNGTSGSSGDGGPALNAQLNTPYGVAVDSSGNLFIADTNNHRIRKVTPDGTVSTVAGSGTAGFGGDGGPAIYAQLNTPYGVAVDPAGNIYVADTNNNRIREISVTGIISTIAGTGSSGFRGDGGPATAAWLAQPRRVALDAAGNIFIADTSNYRIRILVPLKQSSTTFALADGGGMSVQTGGATSSPTTVGYAQVVPDAGAPTPSGFAIIGLRESNVLVSEAGVPGSGLISMGRIYAEIGNTVNTGVAMANPNNQVATISFFFSDSTGDFAQGTTTISPNGQLAKFLDEPPFNGRPLTGTFTFSSNVPIAVVALRGLTNERSEFLLTSLPVTQLPEPRATTVVFPYFAAGGGWTTQVILVNPTDTVLSGDLEFLDSQGQIVAVSLPVTGVIEYTIPPRSSYKLQTSVTSSTMTTGSIHVLPSLTSAAPAGVAIFSFQSGGITVSAAGVPAQPPGSAFRVYVESLGDFAHGAAGSTQTGLAITNTNSEPTTVLVELDNLDGTSGLLGTLPIPAGGEASLFVNQIPGLESLLTPFRGILRLTSSRPVTVVGLRARYNERHDLLITTTPPENEDISPPASGIFFPHFADAGGYTTQFVLFSGKQGQASSGTMTFISQTGSMLNLVLRE